MGRGGRKRRIRPSGGLVFAIACQPGRANRDVPAGVVEHQDDDLVGAGAALAGEGLEGFLEGLDVDGVEEI